jgi:hypothetical protein
MPRTEKSRNGEIISVFSLVVSIIALLASVSAAWATWAQVEVANKALSEKLILGTAEVAVGLSPDSVETYYRFSEDPLEEENVYLFVDVVNIGRGDGLLAQVSLEASDERVGMADSFCKRAGEDDFSDCPTPIAIEHGERVLVLYELDDFALTLLGCNNTEDSSFSIILRSSSGATTYTNWDVAVPLAGRTCG